MNGGMNRPRPAHATTLTVTRATLSFIGWLYASINSIGSKTAHVEPKKYRESALETCLRCQYYRCMTIAVGDITRGMPNRPSWRKRSAFRLLD